MGFGLSDLETVFGGLAGIANKARQARGISQDEADRARQGQDAGGKRWQGDRAAKANEWHQLAGEYNSVAPSVVQNEPFETWTHKQIWNALNGDGKTGQVSAGDIANGVDGWRNLVQSTHDAIDTFNKSVETNIQNLWSGKSANAAIDATRTYSAQAQKLSVAFQEVANGISTIQGYLDQAKMSVEEPQHISGVDEFLGHIPGNGVLKLHKYRAQEAQARAQQVMASFYQPGAAEVDGRTPVLPRPVNPVQNPTQQPVGPDTQSGAPNGPTEVGAGAPGADPGANRPGSTGNSNGTDPSSTNPNGTQQGNVPGPGGTNPDGTNPAGLNTSSTVPSSTDPGSPTSRPAAPGTPTTPAVPPTTTTGPGSPSTVGGVPRGVPGINTPGTTRAPGGPGRSIPGGPNAPGTNPAAARAAAGKAGAPGAGGMSPHGGGKKDDDEGTVQPKDYLVWERENELFGQLPPALPPGGVIGG